MYIGSCCIGEFCTICQSQLLTYIASVALQHLLSVLQLFLGIVRDEHARLRGNGKAFRGAWAHLTDYSTTQEDILICRIFKQLPWVISPKLGMRSRPRQQSV